MAIDWLNGLIIPTIKVTFIVGIGSFILFYVGKAVHNAWSKQTKFWFKFKIRRKSYPEKYVKWILNCVDKGIGYYDTKKLLMISNYPDDKMWEILWIYDRIIDELNLKGGLNKNGRKFERSNSQIKATTELPSIKE